MMVLLQPAGPLRVSRRRDLDLGYYRGPLRYPRKALLAKALRSREVQGLLDAAPNEVPEVLQAAHRFAEGMLPSPSWIIHNLAGVVLQGALAMLFDRMHISGADSVQVLDHKVTRIYVASHAGCHSDEFFMKYGIWRSGFRTPVIVAGEHLLKEGQGALLRWGGALLVKRGDRAFETLRRRGAPTVYRATLAGVLGTLLRENVDLLLFPEGAPAVDGRPRRIRTGILRELVRLARHGLGRQVAVVPVNLRYDRHFEEDVFLRVTASGSWRGVSTFSWRSWLQGLPHLRRHYGTMHLHFGQPCLLDELIGCATESEAATTARLADWIGESIHAAAPLTAASLAAVSLVPAPSPLSFDELNRDAARLQAVLSALSPAIPASKTVAPLAARLHALCRVELFDEQDGLVVIDARQRARLAWHRNLELPRLAVPAMVCRSLLAGIDRPAAIVAAWQAAFPRIRDKLHLAVAPARLPGAIAHCLKALAGIGAVDLQPDERIKLRRSGQAFVERLADAFDLERDIDRHVEI